MSGFFRRNGFRSAWASRRFVLCSILTTLVLAAPGGAEAGPVTITIAASADAVLEDSQGNGAFDKINPLSLSSNGIYVRNYLGGYPNYEDRAVVLFSLGRLAPGDRVTGLVLHLNETLNANGVGGIAIDGYSSTGVISLADATAAGPALASFDATVGAGSHSVVLDTSYLQSLVNSGAAYLGVRLEGTERSVVTLFDSIESSRSFAPSLTVTYVSEPSGIALLASGMALGAVGLRNRGKRRRGVPSARPNRETSL